MNKPEEITIHVNYCTDEDEASPVQLTAYREPPQLILCINISTGQSHEGRLRGKDVEVKVGDVTIT